MSLLETHIDEVCFKLVHYLENIDKQFVSDEFIVAEASTENLVKHINSCYEEEGLTISDYNPTRINQFTIKTCGSTYMISENDQ